MLVRDNEAPGQNLFVTSVTSVTSVISRRSFVGMALLISSQQMQFEISVFSRESIGRLPILRSAQ